MPMESSIQQVATDFNDCGVRMSETGYREKSLALFRCAVDILSSRNEHVASAEQLCAILSDSPDHPHTTTTFQPSAEPSAQWNFSNGTDRRAAAFPSPEDQDQNTPHVFRTPMRIPRHHTEPGSQMGHLVTAIALFNLAVTHQSLHSNHPEVPLLYRASAAALAEVDDSAVSFALAVATLNNFGVWCHTTGNMDGTRASLERLALLLAEEDEFFLDEQYVRGVHDNINMFCDKENSGELSSTSTTGVCG